MKTGCRSGFSEHGEASPDPDRSARVTRKAPAKSPPAPRPENRGRVANSPATLKTAETPSFPSESPPPLIRPSAIPELRPEIGQNHSARLPSLPSVRPGRQRRTAAPPQKK